MLQPIQDLPVLITVKHPVHVRFAKILATPPLRPDLFVKTILWFLLHRFQDQHVRITAPLHLYPDPRVKTLRQVRVP